MITCGVVSGGKTKLHFIDSVRKHSILHVAPMAIKVHNNGKSTIIRLIEHLRYSHAMAGTIVIFDTVDAPAHFHTMNTANVFVTVRAHGDFKKSSSSFVIIIFVRSNNQGFVFKHRSN